MIKNSKLIYIFIYFILILFLFVFISNVSRANQQIDIIADKIESDQKNEVITATGNVILIYPDKTKIQANTVIYNRLEEKIVADGNVIINDNENNVFFLDQASGTNDLLILNGSNVKARLKDNSRIVGSDINKKGDISILNNAEFTPCDEKEYLIDKCPGWKIKSKRIIQNNENKTVYYDHARLYLFNLPLIYLPHFSHPDPSVNKRTGFLMPTTQTDDNLGNQFRIPFFVNIDVNKDLTFTPSFQSKANNFYSIEYRHLNEFGNFNVEASIDDNSDSKGTRNHIFLDADINNKFGQLNSFIKTSNNDTYMRKNKINKLTVLESGFDFRRVDENIFFSLDASSYKHLTIQNNDQWEYLYPKIVYDIKNIENDLINTKISISNDFSHRKGLDNSYSTLASSQIDLKNKFTNQKNGLVFDNVGNLRIVSTSTDNKISKDTENIRFYPQLSSKISLPLFKINKNSSQSLTPIFMPILAPYNNYTSHQSVTNSNLFSSNRASSLTEWESGPRLNYGVEWFIDHKNQFDLKLIAGQSIKVNKESNDNTEELSDFYVSSNFIFGKDKYINNSLILDKDNHDIKSNALNLQIKMDKFKIGADYDYNSGKYFNASEQLRVAGGYQLYNGLNLNFTGAKDIDKNKNIGYQYGLLYENDCIGIDFNYYRDLTKDRDISESDGLSFTVVLKPFGSTKNYGTNRIFGPRI